MLLVSRRCIFFPLDLFHFFFFFHKLLSFLPSPLSRGFCIHMFSKYSKSCLQQRMLILTFKQIKMKYCKFQLLRSSFFINIFINKNRQIELFLCRTCNRGYTFCTFVKKLFSTQISQHASYYLVVVKILFQVISFSTFELIRLHITIKCSTNSPSRRLNGNSSRKSKFLFIFATESKTAQSRIIFYAASASEYISVESCMKEPSSLQKSVFLWPIQ